MAISAPTQLATRSVNTSGQTAWTTASVTFPAGALGIQLFDNAGGTNFATGVTDSSGGTWTIIQFAQRNSQNWTSFAYRHFTAGATCTVTTAFASSNETFGYLGYVTGHDSASPIDTSGNAQGFTTTLTATTAAALGTNDDLLLCVFGGGAAPSSWPPSSFTTLFNPADGVRVFSASFAYRLLTGGSGATQSVAVTYGSSQNTSGGIVAIKPAAAGGTTTTVVSETAAATGAGQAPAQLVQPVSVQAAASGAALSPVAALLAPVPAATGTAQGIAPAQTVASPGAGATSTGTGNPPVMGSALTVVSVTAAATGTCPSSATAVTTPVPSVTATAEGQVPANFLPAVSPNQRIDKHRPQDQPNAVAVGRRR